MRTKPIYAHKQGTFFQNQGTIFAKSGHLFSIFKKGQGVPPPPSLYKSTKSMDASVLSVGKKERPPQIINTPKK